ncbi:MAG: membrane protein insertion efficiency factor YidD [Patescibacteria group bacterium]
MLTTIKLTARVSVLKLIRFYQKTLSPDHGWGRSLLPRGGCRFHPSCSEYTYQAIDKYGVVKGGIISIKRISRCHPWQSGGFDPVP